MAPITGFYGALAALWLVVLAANVIRNRWHHKVGLGDGDNPHMLRAMRIHANAAEYIPIVLIVMMLFELEHGAPLQLHISGIALIAGRVAHTWGLSRSSGASIGRASGIVLTLVAILIPSVGILIKTYAHS